MTKHNHRKIVAALMALGLCGSAFAQSVPGNGQVQTQVAPGVVAAQGSNLQTSPAVAALSNSPSPLLGDSPEAAELKHTLRDVNKLSAKKELMKLQGEIARAEHENRLSMGDAGSKDQKDPALALQQQLEQSMGSKAGAAPNGVQGLLAQAPVAAPVAEQTISILTIYGTAGNQRAEILVGETVDTYTIGDILSTGHKVTNITPGLVTLVRGKKGKPELLKVNGSATVEVYNRRGKSGITEAPGVAPAGANATAGSNAGANAINQLMGQTSGNGFVPPLPGNR